MLSYKERLETFKNWPTSHVELSKRLAILGQYSTSEEALSTCCAFCKTTFDGWDPTDTPLMRHLAENPKKCVIFKLQYLSGRRTLAFNHPEADKYSDRRFIHLNITGKSEFFCMRCGGTSLAHECDGKIQRITENMDMKTAQFYIRYLNGEYVDQADACVIEVLQMKDEQKKLLTQLLSMEKTHFCGLESLESFLNRSADRIFQELEKKMKSMENNAVETMYNESIIL